MLREIGLVAVEPTGLESGLFETIVNRYS